jgi:hypothetical protein
VSDRISRRDCITGAAWLLAGSVPRVCRSCRRTKCHCRHRAKFPRASGDWRRADVDRFVRSLYQGVHRIKPWLRIGVSPFGLPRAQRRQPGSEGFDPHAKLVPPTPWLGAAATGLPILSAAPASKAGARRCA